MASDDKGVPSSLHPCPHLVPKKLCLMPTQHLNDRFIRSLKTPENSRVEYYDDHLIQGNKLKKRGVKGLALRITSSGKRSFVYRYWYHGRSKRYTIGSYPEWSLSDARDKARELHELVSGGIDPLAEKQQRIEANPITFRQAVKAYKEKHLPSLKESTQTDYKRRIEVILNGLNPDRHIRDMKRFEVLEFLEEQAPVQGQRIQAILSGIFKFALNRDWVDSNIATNINLAGKRIQRKKKWQNVEFDDSQIKRLWDAFSGQTEPVQSFFKMLLILGQRSGETRLMKWRNINLDKQIWTIPETDTKNSLIHFVPLSPMALEILDHLKPWTGNSEFVFESQVKRGEPIGHPQKTAQRIREKFDIKEFNPHSLRTTFATRVAGLGTPPQVLSKLLNHKKPGEGSTITAIYNKYNYEEEKRIALNKWDRELTHILTDERKVTIHKLG